MKARIEKLMPAAIDKASELRKKDEKENLVKDKDGNYYIPKEFKSYISSFGASVIQSGLIPTLAFYSNSEGASEDRGLILEAIYKILNIKSESENLLKYVVEKYEDYKDYKDDKELLIEKIMDAATALKLAIRTYKLS